MTPSREAWYALRLRGGYEFLAGISLQTEGFTTFLPTWSEQVQWSDRKKTIIRTLFPGYMFVRMRGFEDFQKVFQTRGMIHILPNTHCPEAIPDEQIRNLRRAIDSLLPLQSCDFHAGEEVVIETGALAGVKGVIVRTRGALRVVVSVPMLMRYISVEIDASDLKKEQAPA